MGCKYNNTTHIKGLYNIENTYTLIRPCSLSRRSRVNVQTRSKTGEEGCRQTLGEDVSILKRRWDMKHTNLTYGNLIMHEVNIHLKVFRALMLNWIRQ